VLHGVIKYVRKEGRKERKKKIGNFGNQSNDNNRRDIGNSNKESKLVNQKVNINFSSKVIMENVGALTSLITKVTIVLHIRTYVGVNLKFQRLLSNFNQNFNVLTSFCERSYCLFSLESVRWESSQSIRTDR
jgi:hypothetical protein